MIGWQTSPPLGETIQYGGVHQIQEPVAIHLKGAQTTEQLLSLVYFRRREAGALGLSHHIGCRRRRLTEGGIARQQEPADGRAHQGRQSQSGHHGPQTALGSQFPFFHPAQAARWCGRWSKGWECGLSHGHHLRGQRHSPIRPGHWTRLFRHRHRLQGCQR